MVLWLVNEVISFAFRIHTKSPATGTANEKTFNSGQQSKAATSSPRDRASLPDIKIHHAIVPHPLHNTSLFRTANQTTLLELITAHLQTSLTSTYPTVKMVVPSTCCGKSGQECICGESINTGSSAPGNTNNVQAAQAKCSCGEKPALNCTCSKAETENKTDGPRCSCRKFIMPTLDQTVWY